MNTETDNLIDSLQHMHDTVTRFTDKCGEQPSAHMSHICQKYTGSPDSPGFVLLMVAAPDKLIHVLQAKLDATMRDLFTEHGLAWLAPKGDSK